MVNTNEINNEYKSINSKNVEFSPVRSELDELLNNECFKNIINLGVIFIHNIFPMATNLIENKFLKVFNLDRIYRITYENIIDRTYLDYHIEEDLNSIIIIEVYLSTNDKSIVNIIKKLIKKYKCRLWIKSNILLLKYMSIAWFDILFMYDMAIEEYNIIKSQLLLSNDILQGLKKEENYYSNIGNILLFINTCKKIYNDLNSFYINNPRILVEDINMLEQGFKNLIYPISEKIKEKYNIETLNIIVDKSMYVKNNSFKIGGIEMNTNDKNVFNGDYVNQGDKIVLEKENYGSVGRNLGHQFFGNKDFEKDIFTKITTEEINFISLLADKISQDNDIEKKYKFDAPAKLIKIQEILSENDTEAKKAVIQNWREWFFNKVDKINQQKLSLIANGITIGSFAATQSNLFNMLFS